MMVDIYTIALCATLVLFGLVVVLFVMLIKDQSALGARQKIVENRVNTELASFREQIKLFKRADEAKEEG